VFGSVGIIVLVLAAVFLLIVLTPRMPDKTTTVSIPYSPTFLAQVKAGNVSAISSKGDTVHGTFRAEVRYPSDAATATTSFSTQIPEFANSNALIALLQS